MMHSFNTAHIDLMKTLQENHTAAYNMNCLCTAYAIIIMHTHQQLGNPNDFVQELINVFSQSTDLAMALLMILNYMASDCDNDAIVIEDSVRRSFYTFLDQTAHKVFLEIYNEWAKRIITGQL